MEPWVAYKDRPSRLKQVGVLAVLAGLGWVGWSWFTAEPDNREPLNRAIDGIVESAMADGSVAGMSVVVTRGFRVLHAAGYGYADVENQVPATPETVYKVGSITKQFTAAAIVQQVEAGTLALDASIVEQLPEYRDRLTHLSGVRLRQLLNHTAGVADYTMFEESWRVLGLEMTPVRVLESFQDAPLDFSPGARFSYSNSGYVLLGLALESATGRPYGGLLNETVFVPAGLASTAYCDERSLVPQRAHGYEAVDGTLLHAQYVSMSQVYSAGAICSTAMDLVRWMRSLSRGEVVSNAGYELMTTPGTLADGSPIEYGFGLAVGYLEGHRRVSHVGGFVGYMGQLARYPDDDVTIAVLSNTDAAPAAQVEGEIARLVIGVGARENLDLALSAEELARYIGRFDIGPTTVDVLVVDGRLHADVRVPRLAGRYTLLYQGDHVFAAETDPEVRLTFRLSESDRATGFVLQNRGIVMEAERLPDR